MTDVGHIQLLKHAGSECYQNLEAKRRKNIPICTGATSKNVPVGTEVTLTLSSVQPIVSAQKVCFSFPRVLNTGAEVLPLWTSVCTTRETETSSLGQTIEGNGKKSPSALAEGVN